MEQSIEEAGVSSNVGPRSGAPPEMSAEQRRKVRRSTWVVSLIAVAVYLGYIVWTFVRTHR